MTAYYNEIDKNAAAWLRELIKAGAIAPGDVDDRSIVDVSPADLRGYTQHHFFAGIGIWSYALREAGWPDDRPVFTGSPPCQPFSSAGMRKGFDDERHLWPVFFNLIRQHNPDVVFGEQVASKDALAWLDVVHTQMEDAHYAFGALDLCAAGVGAPHIRQRLFMCGSRHLADPFGTGWQGRLHRGQDRGRENLDGHLGRGSPVVRLADGDGDRCDQGRSGVTAPWDDGIERDGPTGRVAYDAGGGRREERAHGRGIVAGDRPQGVAAGFEHGGCDSRLADTDHGDRRGREFDSQTGTRAIEVRWGKPPSHGPDNEMVDTDGNGSLDGVDTSNGRAAATGSQHRRDMYARPTNGFWANPDWLGCRDGKWRPVESEYVEMVDGSAPDMGHDCDNGHVFNIDESRSRMQALLDTFGEEEVQRQAGGQWCVREESLLRPHLHGRLDGRPNESGIDTKQSSSVGEGCDGGVRHLQQIGNEIGCPSSRRESDEQRSLELADIVRLLPRSLTLAVLRRRWDDADKLRVLQRAVCEERGVSHPPESLESVWASLSQEAKDRIGLGFDVGAWRRVVSFPLAHGEPARVARLRGYGNGIVSEVAIEFISAYLDAEAAAFDRRPVADCDIAELLG